MKEKKNKKIKKVESITRQWHNLDQDYINSDILGSYTGTPDELDLMPEQDADDL